MCENPINFKRIADSAKNARVKEVFTTLATGENKLCNQSQLLSNPAILVSGDINSGRRIFTRWIAGYDTNFVSKPDETNAAEYVIVDPNGKIDESSPFPVLLFDQSTNTVYYDFPALPDSTGEAYNIAATYFKQTVIENVSSVKMCLLIEHHKVIYSLNHLDDWLNILDYFTEVFQNVSTVKSSVILVVSKVSRAFSTTPDDQIIDTMVQQIQQKLKPALVQKNGHDEVQASKINTFFNLLTSKENNVYPRITLFRSPNKQGLLSSDDLQRISKEKVREKLKNLNFINTTSNDVGFTISKAFLYDNMMMIREIRNDLISDVKTSCKELQRYFSAKEAMINVGILGMDLTHMYEEMKSGYQKVLAIKTLASASATPGQCLHRFIDGVTITINDFIKLNLSAALNSAEATQFLHTIAGNKHVEVAWCVYGLSDIIQYLDDSQKWYRFAKSLYNRMLDCNINKNVGTYIITNEDLSKKVSETNLKAFLFRNRNEEQLFLQYDDIKEVVLTEFKLESARQIANLTAEYHTTLQICLSNNSTDLEGPPICDIYKTQTYINDLYHLDDKFYKQSDRGALYLPYYESLYALVEGYIEKRATNKSSDSRNFAALNHLQIAILSRIRNVDSSINNLLVVNDLYLYSFERLVDDYSGTLAEVRTEVHQETYKLTINTQIIETYSELESVTLRMDKINEDIDYEIRPLLEAKDNERPADLIARQEKLASLLLFKTLLEVLKVSSIATIFCGPVGTVASAAAGLIIRNLGGYLNVTKGITQPMIEGVPKFGKSTQDVYPLEKINLQENLLHADIGNESPEVIALIASDENHENIVNIIGNLTESLKDYSLTENDYWEKKRYAKEELDRYYEQLLQEQVKLRNSKTDNRETKMKKCLALIKWTEYVKGAFRAAESGIDRFENQQQNENLMSWKVTDFIKQIDGKLGRLKEYERRVRAQLLPEINTIQADMTDVLQNSTVKLHAVLAKNRQLLQNLVRDFGKNKGFMIQIPTTNSPITVNITACFPKFLGAMDTSVQVYNSVQNYEDQIRLVHYFDNLRLENNATDYPCLSLDIEHLDLQIRANLILREYQKAVCTVKHQMFPFAHLFSYWFNVTPYLEPSNINHLRRTAFEHIRKLRSDLYLLKIGIRNSSDHIYCNVQFDITNSQKAPFFIWRHETYHEKVSQLLQGREIILKASITEIRDIRNTELNAVKFSEVGIRFILRNASKNNMMPGLMSDFLVKMTHLGDSYYRCRDNYFVFDHKVISMTHSVNAQNDSTFQPHYHYLDTSGFTIQQDPPIFSPYTTWKISLLSRFAITNQTETTFEKLKVLEQEQIDLALEGRGSYVNISSRVCEDEIEKYYKLAGTLPGPPIRSYYRYDPNSLFATNSADGINSPINMATNWLTNTLVYFVPFWLSNQVHRNPIEDNFQSIFAPFELPDAYLIEDYATTVATSVKFNVHESLILADFFIRWLTNKRPYNNCIGDSMNSAEITALALNLVEQMENMIQFYLPTESGQLDALALISKLEKELRINRKAAAIIDVLHHTVVDSNPNLDHSISDHIRRRITEIVLRHEQII